MRQVNNPVDFRNKIKLELLKHLPDEKTCNNLEKGIYNFCIKESNNKNIIKKWDNIYFILIYVDKFRTIINNVSNNNINNKELQNKIMSKEIKPHEVAFMTHQEMKPAHWKKLLDIIKERENNKYVAKLEANTENFTCRKCYSNQCSYYQLQTRSADEPMTTFVTCTKCGSRWKC